MRAVIQRVSQAAVSIEQREVARIGAGLLVLLGVAREDGEADAAMLAEKIPRLRIFADQAGRMNRSLDELGAAVLVVSQFTLLADSRKGRRPSYIQAAEPAQAKALYERFIALLRQPGRCVASGIFGASMQVSLINEGPVTLILESR